MEFPIERLVNNENETKSLAREFSSILTAGDIILLNGNLGTGKTFFVKSVLENFNVSDVNSPTFAIVNEYNSSRHKFYHFDFYRINKEYELYDIGIDDYLWDPDAITFIEWADLFHDVVNNFSYRITFEFIDEGKRRITIEKH